MSEQAKVQETERHPGLNLIGPGPKLPARRQSHRPERPPCAFCHGDGEVCNPGNADPGVKVTEWLYPQVCPRCGGTGKDPNP